MAGNLEQAGSVPVPDPTKLTTDAVSAAKIELKELFDTKLDSLRSELVDFEELVKEKFVGRDTALAAALKAAQELVKQQNDTNAVAADKAEKYTTKQLDALGLRVDDLKERIGELTRKDWTTVGAYIVGAIGIAGMVVTALTWHH
jgi:hypothetical protein